VHGRLWLRPIMPDIKMTLLPEVPTPVVLSRYWRTPGHVPRWVMRRSYSGPTGGETLLARGHWSGRKLRYGSGSGLVHFRLVVPPLQPVVVGLYLARDE
jgi:hypothetical protein